MSTATTTLPAPPGFDDSLLQQLRAGHSADQQLWLSGYLYGLATAGQATGAALYNAPLPQPGQEPRRMSILYGSQTGNSKKAAHQVAELARQQGYAVAINDLNEYPAKNLKEERLILLIVSTQGEGVPPTAAEEFHRWLHSARAPKLTGLRFAVCALGDKSYLQFCQTGKEFDERLEALGGVRLQERAECDVDYEDIVEAWALAVLGRLDSETPAAASTAKVLSRQAVATLPQYTRKTPFAAPLFEKIQLNGRGSVKESWHLELSLEGSGLTYAPGDSLGVFATNAPGLVDEVLQAAGLGGGEPVVFGGIAQPLSDVLQHNAELTVLTRDLLNNYFSQTKDLRIKQLLDNPADLKNYLWGRNLSDLLADFPAGLPAQNLTDILRPIPPRLYSIASSLAAHPDEVHLTVAALRYEFNGRQRAGLASTFLADRFETGDSIPVFIENNAYFKLPDDDSADIIMVGPGTGVAPFRAFVEEREARGGASRQPGKNWLFFGNPNFTTDFLYQTEWLQHLKRGTLDRLDVAFSRDQPEKIYVQHRLLERSKLVYDRLENGAYFYVCGDKNRMAADVQVALMQIIGKESGKGAEYAAEYLKNLKKQRRFLEDVY